MTSENMTQRIGSITDFVVPTFELPPIKEERVADISGQVSGLVNASAALGLFSSFFKLIGLGALLEGTKAAFGRKDNLMITIKFPQTTRTFVDPIVFAKALVGRDFDTSSPLYNTMNRYYATAGVFWTPSISIISTTEIANAIKGSLSSGMTKVSVKRLSQSATQSEITFSGGKKKLAYGVQLFELHQSTAGEWSLGNSGYIKVRGRQAIEGRFRPPVYARLYEPGSNIGLNIAD